MKQRFALIGSILLMVLLLVGLNAAQYIQTEKEPETEANANRSSLNPGPTGVKAFYDFLDEAGFHLVRWREPIEDLTTNKPGIPKPDTFVVIGRTQVQFKGDEATALLRWVWSGNRLVVIDRGPHPMLLPKSKGWNIAVLGAESPAVKIESNDVAAMTTGAGLAYPAQPTNITRDIESVQPSRFANTIGFRYDPPPRKTGSPEPTPAPTPAEYEDEMEDETPPPPAAPVDETENGGTDDEEDEPESSTAPVVQVRSTNGPIVADYAYGSGRILIISDPFLVSNAGIASADNLQLVTNVVAGSGGIIAFDEFHQGLARTSNEWARYFAGTPFLAILSQLCLITLFIVWTNSRRFARPLPLKREDRRSTLEFVSSMAELQLRAGAYDLAIENIYSRLRRFLVRYGGTSTDKPNGQIAERVAERSGLDREEIESVMQRCEEIINGASISKQDAVSLVTRIRELEKKLRF
jgi:Domain of unknown function (DUF4350)